MTYDLLVEEQNGFRRERGCIDHLFSLYNIMESGCLGKEIPLLALLILVKRSTLSTEEPSGTKWSTNLA